MLNARSIANKSFLCNDIITLHNIDFFLISETWLTGGHNIPLAECSPPGFTFLYEPRMTGRVGGLAVVYRNNFKCSRCDLGSFSSFETLPFVLKGSAKMLCILIYYPIP